MVNLNNPALLLDSDVLVNWLSLEEDIVTHTKLWDGPHKIITLIEEGRVNGYSTLINIMEIRFVLRRKKKFSENKIQMALAKLAKLINITIPDEINLLKADELQIENPSLSPIDSVLLSVAMAMRDIILISRDQELLKIASKVIPASTPEEFLAKIKL